MLILKNIQLKYHFFNEEYQLKNDEINNFGDNNLKKN